MLFRSIARATLLFALLLLAVFAHADDFFSLLEMGEEQDVRAMVAKTPALVNQKDEGGRTPLQIVAMRQDDTTLLQFLLDKGAVINGRGDEGGTALLAAANCGNLSAVKLLLLKGADPKIVDFNGDTFLHHAVVGKEAEIVNLALTLRGDVRARNDAGCTPLHVLLGETGVDMSWYAPRFSYTPTQRALLGEVRKLLPAEMRENFNGMLGITGEEEMLPNSTLSLAKLLLDKGADMEAASNTGVTPLLAAARIGNAEVVKYLLDRGAKATGRDEAGRTLLHYAATCHQRDMMQWALDKGCEVQAVDDGRNTPLHLALNVVAEGTITQYYHGMSHAYSRNELPFDMVSHFFREEIADLPKETLAKVEGLLAQVRTSPHLETVTFLLARGARATAVNNDGNTPLYGAALLGSREIVQALLDKGADPLAKNELNENMLYPAAVSGNAELLALFCDKGCSVKDAPRHGYPLLHLTAASGQRAAVTFLLAKGAAVNATDRDGHTALHLSVSMHYALREAELLGTVQTLLDKGANVNAQNESGVTPLHIAARDGLDAVVKLLLKAGANPALKDRHDRTPAQLATENDYPQTAALLQPKPATPPKNGKE